jgi:hypothetical protein
MKPTDASSMEPAKLMRLVDVPDILSKFSKGRSISDHISGVIPHSVMDALDRVQKIWLQARIAQQLNLQHCFLRDATVCEPSVTQGGSAMSCHCKYLPTASTERYPVSLVDLDLVGFRESTRRVRPLLGLSSVQSSLRPTDAECAERSTGSNPGNSNSDPVRKRISSTQPRILTPNYDLSVVGVYRE